MIDELGDRMKEYEGKESARRFMPLLPVLARLDGKAFHTFCRSMEKPFDEQFSRAMLRTMEWLVAETNALVGYTQSDEISLLFYSDDHESQIFFDGRIQKMTSILAAMCSVRFNQEVSSFLLGHERLSPLFDCRVWQVPNQMEAANYFLWRENDATRNSILSAGFAAFPPKQMYGLKTNEIQEKLFREKQINWNDYPEWAKRGSWARRLTTTQPFTADEIDKLPEKHEARKNPELQVERHEVREWLREGNRRFGSMSAGERVEALFGEGETP